ncbi:S26 family signal peptidase [Natrinema gari]|uniref:Peptidase S24/S26A/S26B, conserved region n=1 Tax=Natrinema gari JCM 14663 TaxID=1230459 RepID=L9Z057_9EURY|nr:S26 family signal peptidase [Natrinema gari]ELY79067.1 Peptidase S24/S26A/S26B, conserved region [Natrinema gari JCM 14663]
MDGPDGDTRDADPTGPRDGRSRPDSARRADPGDRAATPTKRDPDRRDRATDDDHGNPTHNDGVAIEDGIGRWLLATDDWRVTMCRDIAASLAVIATIGLLLFAVGGTWPPFVAVESGSMEPNVREGDLVFVVDNERFAGENAIDDTGIVTLESGRETGHEKFANAGDVIVFIPNGDPTKTPTIHRAHFWVERGERWVETKADPGSLNGATCDEIATCPAPHDGFVTKGDANPGYDQLPRSGAETTVVSPDWITGKGMVRVPWVGELRLAVDSAGAVTGLGPTGTFVVTGTIALVLFGMAAGDSSH